MKNTSAKEMETTPRKTGEELRDGATDSEKSPPIQSSELNTHEQYLIQNAIEEAEENDPVLVVKWNHVWLNLPGNTGGKWKKDQILS
jgi:hypothetical protein